MAGRRRKSVMRYSTAALVLFGLSILSPQGVGVRLPAGLPHLDLPRLAIFALIGLFFLRTSSSGRLPINGAPRTLTILVLLSLWQFVAASASESPRWSLVWATGNLLTYWGFAFAFIVLVDPRGYRGKIVKTLIGVGTILALWSIIEFGTQGKLFAVRNLWAGAEVQRFSPSLRRIHPGMDIDLPLMSIGPYAINLSLASSLCVLGGFLLLRGRKARNIHRVTSALFVLGVLATQSRAGVIAAALMIVISTFWRRSGAGRLWPLTIVVAIATIAWFSGEYVRGIVSGAVKFSDFWNWDDSAGSVAGRVLGLRMLFQQIDGWWLWGFGPGSLFDPERVTTSVVVFSDPGSFFALFVESGLMVGLLLTWLMVKSILDGSRSADPDVQAATLGLIGFAFTALISLSPWVWGTALVLAGLIESWSKPSKAPVELSTSPLAPMTPPIG